MAGISIPGVTDKYKSNETVEKLMQIERIPLTREEKTLEAYKKQQDAWRDVNRKVTSLRDSVKSLYSFENPFNNKLTESTDENAITATATRNATYDSFKVDVIQEATADRFLTSELDENTKVPAGTYTYKIADKLVTMRWKGGSLQDFSTSLNRRGNDLLKTRVIGASKGKKTLAIESLKTGEENKLSFEDDAKTFAETTGMIIKVKPKSTIFGSTREEYQIPSNTSIPEQDRMPSISMKGIKFLNNEITIPPRNGYKINIPDSVKELPNNHLLFSIKQEDSADITIALNKQPSKPIFPDSGSASFRDITILNSPVDASLPSESPVKQEPLEKISTSQILFAIKNDGTEIPIQTDNILTEKESKIDLNLSDYSGIDSLVIRNRNTGKTFSISSIEAYNPNENLGFIAQHPISTANDAIIKYEGITIKRPKNEIDDVVPEVTLNVHGKTDKTATISVKPDVESAKDALITFVGKYNQAIGQINILSQNKGEIIEEMDYLTEDERTSEKEKLGLFLSDSSLNSLKSNIQSITQARYPFSEDSKISMLSQIGIATNASSYSGYSPSKLRGYLEIDEKKLDGILEKDLDQIKNLFGYDTDGDLIVDSGIGVKLDKQLTAYVQTGGIFSLKTSSLDSKIKSSEQKITRLESQMEEKEANLRNKYGQMEGALNSLESQQTTITNISNRGNNN